MDPATEMRSFESDVYPIPAVVNEEPTNQMFMSVSMLKKISNDIEHIKESNDDLHNQVNLLTETVDYLVRQSNSNCNKEINKSLKSINRELRSLKDKDKQSSMQKDQRGVLSTINGGTLQHNGAKKDPRPSSKKPWAHSVHIEEALQENFVNFVQNMAFTSTPLPDKLLESNCLSDDECSIIRSKHDKDQIRHLLYKIMVRGPEKIFTFLELLRETEYEFLTKKVFDSLERISREQEKGKIPCLVCHIKKTVDLRDVSDYLFHVKIIKRDTYGAIMESQTLFKDREFIWSNIINDVNRADNIDHAINHLTESFKGKYDHIRTFLSESRSSGMQCVCGYKRRRRQKALISDVSSQTDMSTTSEIPNFSELNTNDCQFEADSSSEQSSMYLGASFADLDSYLPNQTSGPCDSTTQENDERTISTNTRARHSSGKFDARKGTVDSTSDFPRQQSIVYVGSNSPVESNSPDSTTRPLFEKSISHTSTGTMRPANSTDSGDTQWLTDGSDGTRNSSSSKSHKTDSPKDAKTIDRIVKEIGTTNAFPKQPFNHKEDIGTSVDTSHNNGRANRIRRLRKTSEFIDGEESAFADGEDDEVLPRKGKSSKHLMHKTQRNRKTVLGKPAPVLALVRHLDRRFHMKKKTRQRKERRERKLQRFEECEEPLGRYSHKLSHNPRQKKVPYNPTWLTHVQKPRSSNWDSNQARRHWLMSHRMADADRKCVKVDKDQSWTEGSDTF